MSVRWQTPAQFPMPRPDRVEVWAIPLDVPPECLAASWQPLSEDERERAQRFHHDRHRRRYVVARSALRQLLGRCLDEDPQQIEFCYGLRGKPALDPRWIASSLEFNLTHSGELALVALTVQRPLGVDVERVQGVRDYQGLAERFFAMEENQLLASLPTDARVAAFFRCWTRKEAILKATGSGLATPLDQVAVTIAEGDPPRVLRADFHPADRWKLAHLEPATGYVGAVALQGELGDIGCWRWTH